MFSRCFRPSYSLIGPSNRRYLFTDEFLGISIMQEKQTLIMKSLKEQNIKPNLLRENLLSRTSESKVLDTETSPESFILTEDLLNLIMTSKSKESLRKTSNFMKDYVYSQESISPLIQKKLVKLFRSFMQICHVEKDLTSIEHLLKDEEFLKRLGFLKKKTGVYNSDVLVILNIYLDHLYEEKRYDDVLASFDEINAKIAKPAHLPWTTITLAMMSCLQLNTTESFVKASEIFNNICDENFQKSARIAHPYALLAHNQGQTVEAYEIVSNVRGQSVMRSGMMVFLLTKLNRLSDAIKVLEAAVKNAAYHDSPLGKKGEKITFSLETVNCLTKAVEESKDKNLQVKLSKAFRKLDAVAAISNKSLLGVVTETIDITKNMKFHREKNKLVRQKTDLTIEMQIEDIEDNEDNLESSTEKN